MAKIEKITSEEILDSRKLPTLRTRVYLDDGSVGTASVPSGTSVGRFEAVELRDKDSKVARARENVEGPIFKVVRGIASSSQEKIDGALIEADGTENKSKLGANAILSVSLAIAKAEASSRKTPLYQYLRGLSFQSVEGKYQIPIPMFNLINGGRHAKEGLTFQEFMVVPTKGVPLKEKLMSVWKVFEALKTSLTEVGLNLNLGAEGGFALQGVNIEQAIVLLKEACLSNFGQGDFGLSLDVAAAGLTTFGGYRLKELGGRVSTTDFIKFLVGLAGEYNLFSLEDPFSEEDWTAWCEITSLLSGQTLITADDLTTTNTSRLEKLLKEKAATGVVVKPNQIGTLSETAEFIKKAKGAGLKIVVSHRSGETEDTFIADLAVAASADFFKAGAPTQRERLVKYERLIEIEDSLQT